VIELRDVHRSFGPKKVLQGFSLTVKEGETLSIIGGSGVGKSVTLKHILGLIEPDSGQILVDGQDVNALEREDLYELRRKVGYVFQFAALFDSMTVGENVAMGLRRIAGMEESAIQARVKECLRLVDLPGIEDRYPSQISGGMQKRVGLARAIATQPKYLLYDEPTTGLDPVTVTLIDRLIMRMAEELGVTGIVITHDMESAYRISNRMAMLYEGKIRTMGTPEEIRASQDPIVQGFIEGRPELLGKGDVF
jgi:phospholipid/cholesterol/gamma-HCH transport system ATP-binding protein